MFFKPVSRRFGTCSSLFLDLKKRGSIAACTAEDEVAEKVLGKCGKVYAGFDPTADSLHLGHLAVLVMLRRFQLAGHVPVCLVGGATGLIGDPSGKSSERELLDREHVERNVKGISRDISRVISMEGDCKAEVVDNLDWFGGMNALSFLRDIGKHFRVSSMLAKDCVSNRMEGEGISFTEFSYPLLQAFDFWHLYSQNGVSIQIGGSDQWGNITAGVQLIRKLGGERSDDVMGLTIPLLVSASGKKFGKSEGNALWLDPLKTTPYVMYQYLLNTADDDVEHLMKLVTLMSAEEIEQIMSDFKGEKHTRLAQKKLAAEVVSMVHGEKEMRLCVQATDIMFGNQSQGHSENTEDLLKVFREAGVHVTALDRGELENMSPIDFALRCNLVSSKKEAQRLLIAGGLYFDSSRLDFSQKISIPLNDLAIAQCGQKKRVVVHLK